MTVFGWVGVAAFAAAWAPQCAQTWREGRCGANPAFLGLSCLGSAALLAHAAERGDAAFAAVNALTTAGALMNAWYAAFPRS